ncbi:MAG TPA: hypothetical protein VL947_13520, partial [Cytophagales bacterium]|nr:hypothetical protein [Cytophagales bacterium]
MPIPAKPLILMFIWCFLGTMYAALPLKIQFIKDLVEIGKYDEALVKTRKLSKNSSVADMIVLMALEGEIYFKLGDYNKAKDAYFKSKTLYLNNDSLYIGGICLVNTSLYMGDYSFAEPTINRLCNLGSISPYWRSEAILTKAMLLDALGYEKSLISFLYYGMVAYRFTETQRFHMACILTKGLIKASQYGEALKSLDSLKIATASHALKGMPIARSYHELMAIYEIEHGNYPKAARHYEEAYASSGTATKEYHKDRYLYHTIICYQKAGKELQKQRFLREAEIRAHQRLGTKKESFYHVVRAKLYLLDGDAEAAQVQLDKVDRSDTLPLGHYLCSEIIHIKYQLKAQEGKVRDAADALDSHIN